MFVLPKLNFEFNALEPYIDAKTMEIHHDKHHAGYVAKLNNALQGHENLESMSIEEILSNLDKMPIGKKDLIRNNGGGHANHSLYWDIITPGGTSISNWLESKIKENFGSLENCIQEVSDAAITQFGSGWGWLALDKNGKLEAVSTPNQDSLYLYGKIPLLGIDVWEHAYYLKYQNLRADYVKAFWKIVNWTQVEKHYKKVLG